jgi:hypothetical protein
VLKHILCSLWVSQLVLDSIQNHCLKQQIIKVASISKCKSVSNATASYNITYLQSIMNSWTKRTMHRFPELRFVAADINVSDHRLRRRKYVISGGPETCRHDDFFSHKNPRQKGIKWDFPQKVGMSNEISSSRKGCKPRNVQLFAVISL